VSDSQAGMSNTFIRMASAVAMAAVFFGCLLICIFGGAGFGGFGQMVVGFGIGAMVAIVCVFLRAPIIWFGATLFLLLAAMGLILLGWKWAGIGAGAAAIDALLLYFGWIRPHTSQPFNHVDYAKEQQKIYEEEKARKSGEGPGAVRS